MDGASEGAGLGHDFIAAAERSLLIVAVLYLAPIDGSDPVENPSDDRARAGRARRTPWVTAPLIALSKPGSGDAGGRRECGGRVARAAGGGGVSASDVQRDRCRARRAACALLERARSPSPSRTGGAPGLQTGRRTRLPRRTR